MEQNYDNETNTLVSTSERPIVSFKGKNRNKKLEHSLQMGSLLFIEKTIPTDIPIVADSNLEMSWFTFGGEYYELYEALVKAWCIKMNLPTDNETVAKYFRLNLERGIAHLCGTGFIKSAEDLVNLAIKEK